MVKLLLLWSPLYDAIGYIRATPIWSIVSMLSPHCCTVPICPSGKVDEILGDLREAKNQKGVAVLEDTVGNTMKKVW